jgi:lysophospholipase L1-like esterase
MKKIKLVLAVSVIVNVLLIALVLITLKNEGSFYYVEKIIGFNDKGMSTFKTITTEKTERAINTVMLGDSLTAKIDWSDFVSENVKGLGVSGDTTINVINRLDKVTDIKPDKLFIMIGINDLFTGGFSADKSIDGMMKNYKIIIDTVQKESPDTTIYVQSLLPIRTIMLKVSNKDIENANSKIKELASEYELQYIDLYQYFYNGKWMAPKYTTDGVHLTYAGYQLWKETIQAYINE